MSCGGPFPAVFQNGGDPVLDADWAHTDIGVTGLIPGWRSYSNAFFRP